MPAVGGVARRATVIKAQRADTEHMLLLDAGGSLIGTQNPALATQGATSVELLNRLAYDAMALGAADLTLGPDALAARKAEAKFPFLSANVRNAATGDLVAEPYVIRETGGHRIALVGVTGADPVAGFTIDEPLAALQKLLPEVSGQADAVIVLANAQPEVDHAIADALPGIAAIITGGPGPQIGMWVSEKTGVPVMQADLGTPGHAGRMIGITTLELDAAGKRTSQEFRQLSLGPEVTDDPAMDAWAREVYE